MLLIFYKYINKYAPFTALISLLENYPLPPGEASWAKPEGRSRGGKQNKTRKACRNPLKLLLFARDFHFFAGGKAVGKCGLCCEATKRKRQKAETAKNEQDIFRSWKHLFPGGLEWLSPRIKCARPY